MKRNVQQTIARVLEHECSACCLDEAHERVAVLDRLVTRLHKPLREAIIEACECARDNDLRGGDLAKYVHEFTQDILKG